MTDKIKVSIVELKGGRNAVKIGNRRIADYNSKSLIVRNVFMKDALVASGYKLLNSKKSSHGDYLKHAFQTPETNEEILQMLEVIIKSICEDAQQK